MNLQYITKYLKIDDCDENLDISGLNTLKDAKQNEISFLENKKYLKDLKDTKAGAVLISKDLIEFLPKTSIPLITEEAYLQLAYLSKLFTKAIIEENGQDAIIGNNSYIGTNSYIGKNTIIGNNVKILPNVFVGDNVKIGDDTILYPNSTVYRDCEIGKNCIIHSGTVIGSDGFGFAHTKNGEHIKIYQNGNVIIENDVEIGSNCSVDRAVFSSTIIKSGSKIDNLVQIAHNCIIGENTIIAGQAGISGSSVLGKNVIIGGQTAVSGHLEIEAFTTVAGRSGVTKSLKGGKTYSGFPAIEHRSWLRLQAKISKLNKS